MDAGPDCASFSAQECGVAVNSVGASLCVSGAGGLAPVPAAVTTGHRHLSELHFQRQERV